MKNLTVLACALGVAGLAVSAAYADPPHPRQICIHTSDINSMSYPDDHTILFRMNGGPVKVWRNELPRNCPGLKFEAGIAWNIWGGEVCSNMQVFYVLRRGTPCMLGTFVPADQPPQSGPQGGSPPAKQWGK
jgi:hypothetical protein